MGIQGVPFKPDRNHIKQVIKRNRAIMSDCCRELDVWRNTLYDFINADPELKAYFEEVRNHVEEEELDEAERTLHYLARKREERPDVSLKASMYKLNNKAQKRGYNHPDEASATKQLGLIDKLTQLRVAEAQSKDQSKKG